MIENWTSSEVRKWISNTCNEYSLPMPYPLVQFQMNGKALLMLTKQDFLSRSKSYGDILYEALSKLKNGKLLLSLRNQIY
jgi:ETS translocation variant 6/7